MTTILLVGGHAGVGKTTLSRHIAKHAHAALIDKDSATRALVDVLMGELTGDPGDRYSAEYLYRVRTPEYDCMLAVALDIAENGVHAVVVAPLLQEITNDGWMRAFTRKCDERGFTVKALWVDRPESGEHRRRLTNRGAERDMWKLENWDEFEESLHVQPLRTVTRISTEGVGLDGMDDLAQRVTRHMFRG